MRILILNNCYNKSENYLYQAIRLKDEFFKLGVSADIKDNDFYACFIDGENINNLCKNYDCCIYFDKDKYISEMLEKSGVTLINSHKSIQLCDDKMLTHIALANNGIPMPKTISAPLCYTKNGKVLDKQIDFIENELSYPLIIKQCFGSLGAGVFKIDNKNDLKTKMDELLFQPHLYQEFIQESEGKDVRAILIGKKVVCAMKRRSENDFRSNIELGGHGEPFELEEKSIKLCEKVASVLDLDYCGIDLLFYKEGFKVCEVNSNAFFGGIEKVTQVNVAKKFAEYVISKCKKNII